MTHNDYGIAMIAIALTQAVGLLIDRFFPPKKYQLLPQVARRLWCYCILALASAAVVFFIPAFPPSERLFVSVLGSGLWSFWIIECWKKTFCGSSGIATKSLREKQRH
jgi:hypothetical protein